MTIDVSTEASDYQELIEDLQQHQFELTQQNEELRRTQQQLNRATEKYRNLWDQAPIGYILHNRTGLISDANLRARDLLEADRKSLKGKVLDRFLDADSRLAFQQHLLSTATTPHSVGVEVKVRRTSDLTERWLRLQSIVTLDGEYRTALMDVTAKKQAEAEQIALASQLQQAQKMEVLHELSAGIAHDFNNLLQIITAYGEISEAQIASQGGDCKPIQTLLQGARRGAELTKRLLAFSRRSAMHTLEQDLCEIVEETAIVLRRTLREDISLRHTKSDEPLPVDVDRGLIEQALLNLCINARDAMADGGRMTIGVRPEKIAEAKSLRGQSLSAGEYAVLTVADDGPGISPEVLEKVFEPFFTTKTSGSGTGLGLSIVYGIVRQHGGAIDVSSELGEGSKFSIFLPTTETYNNEAETLPPRKAISHESRGETILLAEDEPAIRNVLSCLLRQAGYTVVAVEDGQQAIDEIDSISTFDLLLTDVMMPNASGKDVCEAFHDRVPSLPVVFLTGHADSIIDAEFLRLHDAELLRKPLSSADLLATIATKLAAQVHNADM